MRDRKLEKKNPSGLTLMELIITMAVLGILLVAAAPHISQFSSGYTLRGAARELATDLQFARLLAVKENRDIQVVFGSTSYQVAQASPWLVVKSRDFSVDYPGITLTGLTVTFNSRGNSVSRTISVSGPTGTKNITVVSTGRVKLG